ncbi:MAG: AMP-binding protein [Acidimicrobiia bacterium]|nr:AMP-binding protein [Acidimicrobiia bacterium]MYC44563.1 AMP-binding protein [Acidimicrobiia bacterium]MYI19175.1 AMP-binding protein [Acidimicrobiia bacterium]
MTDPLGFWSIAEHDPGRVAVVEALGRQTTFGELAELTNRCTRGLRALGLGTGDGVVTVLPNGLEQVALLLAAYQGGMYATAVNWHLAAPEIAYIVDDSDARVLVSHERFAAEAAGVAERTNVPYRFSVGAVEGFRPLEELTAGQPADRPENLSTGGTMTYTSGTTGRPKGVRRPLRDRHPDESAPLSALLLALFGVKPHEDNVHLCVAPMYHAAGGLWVTMSLHFGHTVVLMDRWDAAGMLELVERHRVTQTHMVPTMFHRLLQLPEDVQRRHDLSSLRHVIHAAAPCPTETKRKMLDWLGDCVWEYYGATEGGGTLASPEDWRRFPGTVGRAWPETEVIVVDSEGQELPPGRSGTVYMKMPERLRFRYHKDEDKTADAHLGEFFTVGDVGYFNEEGYLFLNDRARDVIIVGGVNIYPAEIEGSMQQCPLVGDVAVFGIPDEDLGERIKAVVEPAAGVEPSEETRQAILDFLGGRLAKQRRPHSLDFAEQLPRDPSGKLYKRRLRDPYWEGHTRRI